MSKWENKWGENLMDDYLNSDIYDFDNDASASSFGWDFQVNAGIFLFLKYISNAEDIKIESKCQDIEITLTDQRKVFAQAKSAQDYTSIKNPKEKFKDAVISLSKNPWENNILIYISNNPDTFNSGKECFNNCVVAYNNCLKGVQREIDETIKSVINSINKKIASEDNDKEKKRLSLSKRRLENFHKENLYISAIHPYYGDESSRYNKIGEEILNFLTNTAQLPIDYAVCIKQKLLDHWQKSFHINSTIKDKDSKKISRRQFLWPIVIFLTDKEIPDINDCLSFSPDLSLENEADEIMNCAESVYCERYEFVNKVMSQYNQFKKEYRGENIEKQFIKEHGEEYIEEFEDLGNQDAQLTEYLTKKFLYRILIKNRLIVKICDAVEVKK